MAARAGRSGGHNAKRPENRLGKPRQAQTAMPGYDRIDGSDHEPTVPEANPEWATAANLVWNSVLESPDSMLMTSKDFAYLYIACESITSMAISGYKAMALQAVQAMMRDLGMTEIQRRQAKILIDRTPAEVEMAPVSQIEDARKHFGAS